MCLSDPPFLCRELRGASRVPFPPASSIPRPEFWRKVHAKFVPVTQFHFPSPEGGVTEPGARTLLRGCHVLQHPGVPGLSGPGFCYPRAEAGWPGADPREGSQGSGVSSRGLALPGAPNGGAVGTREGLVPEGRLPFHEVRPDPPPSLPPRPSLPLPPHQVSGRPAVRVDLLFARQAERVGSTGRRVCVPGLGVGGAGEPWVLFPCLACTPLEDRAVPKLGTQQGPVTSTLW